MNFYSIIIKPFLFVPIWNIINATIDVRRIPKKNDPTVIPTVSPIVKVFLDFVLVSKVLLVILLVVSLNVDFSDSISSILEVVVFESLPFNEQIIIKAIESLVKNNFIFLKKTSVVRISWMKNLNWK